MSRTNRIAGARRLIIFAVCAIFLAVPGLAYASGPLFECPIFLNGEPLYSRTGPASLLSIAADAARAAASADVAILPAGCISGSIAAGPVTQEELSRAVPEDVVLCIADVSSQELVSMLNSLMTYGSDFFPHISGLTVYADRMLNEAGTYVAYVDTIAQGSQTIASAAGSPGPDAAYSTHSLLFRLVVTSDMAQKVPWLASRIRPADIRLQDALVSHINRTADSALSYYADCPRLVVVSDTINTQLVLDKLSLGIPAPVVINLSRPDMVSDTIFFALSGQDRDFVCRIVDAKIPYSLSVSGKIIREPVSMNSNVAVTQDIPSGRKTANTFDTHTVFADLRHNDTVPDGTILSIDVAGIYPSETVLYVYYYDERGDIVPADVSTLVDADGWVSFPVSHGKTYLINSRELDSTGFEPPSSEHPYTAGIVIIFGLFVLWVVLFLIRKRKELGNPAPDA